VKGLKEDNQKLHETMQANQAKFTEQLETMAKNHRQDQKNLMDANKQQLEAVERANKRSRPNWDRPGVLHDLIGQIPVFGPLLKPLI